jgi:hypothetical protein
LWWQKALRSFSESKTAQFLVNRPREDRSTSQYVVLAGTWYFEDSGGVVFGAPFITEIELVNLSDIKVATFTCTPDISKHKAAQNFLPLDNIVRLNIITIHVYHIHIHNKNLNDVVEEQLRMALLRPNRVWKSE